MLSINQQAERNRAGVRQWYREHRDEYNATRRKRYAASKAARERARQRAAEYRAGQRSGEVQISRQLFRTVNGKRVKVFSTGQVAEAMGRTPQMLRNWELWMLIPESIFPDTHRLYTRAQMRMLVSLCKIIANTGGRWTHPEVSAKAKKIRENW